MELGAMFVVAETPQAAHRRAALAESKRNPRKGECGHRLSADNAGPLCGPCLTRWRRERPLESPPKARRLVRQATKTRRGSYVFLPGLKEARRRSGLTKSALAAAVGISDRTINKWCSQATRAPVEAIGPLAKVLGVTEDELKGEG